MSGYGSVQPLLPLLAGRFGERLATTEAVRAAHGAGEGVRDPHPPDAVVFPTSAEEVADVVRLCAEHRVPVVPFGVGTSLEGHVQAVHGGVTLNLSGLDRILQVNASDLDARVEAGVTREALNAHIRDQGLFFPLDPGANATLGGMAATRASGTNAVRYGTMRDVTLGLTVVTPKGEVIRTGGRARKSSSGYDLTRLYVGSEGTLGIITEVQLRLFGIPEVIVAGVCQFDAVEHAVEAVTAVLQIGLPIARIEFLDRTQIAACIAYSRLDDLSAAPTLFFELHGSPAAVAEQRTMMSELLRSFGGTEPRWAERQEDRTRLWTARHDAFWAARALKPGYDSLSTDACVPISALPAIIAAAEQAAAESGFTCPIVGHVGDGNFHMMVLYRPDERTRADALATEIARLAIAAGGTATGEHGIGLHRIPLLVEEHGPAVDVMLAIKASLDPDDIMNPGKTLPRRETALA
ncbi:FAD-binding oxidoreductase [uncultured Sphingomonas sp.]|uniref:FAD-binding oxidoreductase n=1 Tax=uncultured Sphingomonas sp. TaxID=158754 RepID=UPI0035CB0BBE